MKEVPSQPSLFGEGLPSDLGDTARKLTEATDQIHPENGHVPGVYEETVGSNDARELRRHIRTNDINELRAFLQSRTPSIAWEDKPRGLNKNQ